jgi:hypothetical protein
MGCIEALGPRVSCLLMFCPACVTADSSDVVELMGPVMLAVEFISQLD